MTYNRDNVKLEKSYFSSIAGKIPLAMMERYGPILTFSKKRAISAREQNICRPLRMIFVKAIPYRIIFPKPAK